jgi:hypothetical protein
MKTKEEFAAACQAVGKNDPSPPELNLVKYSSLLNPKRIHQVVRALENNTFVKDLTFSANLCVHSTLQLSHFLKTSPILQRLQLRGEEQHPKEDEEKAIIAILTYVGCAL